MAAHNGVRGTMPSISITATNASRLKQLYRRDALGRIASAAAAGEHLARDAEISVLLCDDERMQELNASWRGKNQATDVLSFPQAEVQGVTPQPLGDIVISLETVERRCGGNRAAMRKEVCLLFCHGLLHLLGYTHDTQEQEEAMAKKQAEYLGWPLEEAWPQA